MYAKSAVRCYWLTESICVCSKPTIQNPTGPSSQTNLLTPPPLPIPLLQMMTSVEETGGCVPLCELVTGVTTRWCCW